MAPSFTEDETFELSRRKILASAGVIGAAGATTGLGTSAFFSDQETFTNNELVAGELDLKVDWEGHYSDWSDDEAEGIETSSVATTTAPASRTLRSNAARLSRLRAPSRRLWDVVFFGTHRPQPRDSGPGRPSRTVG